MKTTTSGAAHFAKRTGYVNPAELDTSTSDDNLSTDKLSTTNRYTSKPNLSNTLRASFRPLSIVVNDDDKNANSVYPDDFYTSRSYDLYTNLYTKSTKSTNRMKSTNKTKSSNRTKNTNRNSRTTNLFESTSTSLLPLLLFDRHQLAQEINFTTRYLSTASPSHRGHYSRSTKYPTRTKVNHLSSAVSEPDNEPHFVQHSIRHANRKNVEHSANSKSKENGEEDADLKQTTIEMMNTVWPRMHPEKYPEEHPEKHPEKYPEEHPEKHPEKYPEDQVSKERLNDNTVVVDYNREIDRISQTTSVPSNDRTIMNEDSQIGQIKQFTALMNIDYDSSESHNQSSSSLITSPLNDQSTSNQNDRMNNGKRDDYKSDIRNGERKASNLDRMQNDGEPSEWQSLDEIKVPQVSPSNFKQDRLHHSKLNTNVSISLDNSYNGGSIINSSILSPGKFGNFCSKCVLYKILI